MAQRERKDDCFNIFGMRTTSSSYSHQLFKFDLGFLMLLGDLSVILLLKPYIHSPESTLPTFFKKTDSFRQENDRT